MLFITFDSNVWRPVGDPSKFPNDPMRASFEKIHSALQNGEIEGRLSETVFTLEGIARADRKNLLSSYKPKIDITENVHPDGKIQLGFSIGPDLAAHPGNNSFLSSHLNDALALGFKLMHCYRIAGFINQDIKTEWYAETSLNTNDVANKFGEIGRKIEAAGAGIAWVKSIGQSNAKAGEHWSRGLANAPAAQDKEIASAVAEWADGDMVSAHVAYQNNYICTRDAAKGAGKNSVFSEANRTWLEKEYGVKFVSPDELANLL
jgi:hypothetical protein